MRSAGILFIKEWFAERDGLATDRLVPAPGQSPHRIAGYPLAAVIAVFAAIVFLSVFSFRLRAVPSVAYESRDDAVITLSHARNLVEYGFVGVSPSGERVEGFSAPLQFWLAAALYRVKPFSYQSFFRWQFIIGTALLGAMFGFLLRRGPEQRRWGSLALVAAIGVMSAEILARSLAFLLWHASGMENVYKEVALLALLWALDAMLRTSRIRIWAAPLVLLAALARADSIVPTALLLAAFVTLWTTRTRNLQGLRFAALSVLPWLLYMAWRIWYFGQWAPNTAVAQHIAVGPRLAALAGHPLSMLRSYVDWVLEVGGSLHGVQFVWLPILLVWLRRTPLAVNRSVLLGAGALGCLAQFALFGGARMDAARTVPELALYATLVAPWIGLSTQTVRTRQAAVVLTMVASSVVYSEVRPPDRKEIGWTSEYFEPTVTRAEALARQYDIPRPSLANPDLGAVSWSKQFNIIDMGMLGSPVIARIGNRWRYIVGVAKPDIIEIHDAWSCIGAELFTNDAFQADYFPAIAARTPWLEKNCQFAPDAKTGYWVRRAVVKGSGSAERVFLEAFRGRPDVGLVRAEIARCLARAGARPCDYVGRTLFRFVPELKQRGEFDEIGKLLEGDPRLELEHAYFTSSTDPRSWRAVMAWADAPVITVRPQSLSLVIRAGASAPAATDVVLGAPDGASWDVVVTKGDGVDVRPRHGAGPATLSVVARRPSGSGENPIRVSIFGTGARVPSAEFAVDVSLTAASSNGPPAGYVDVPAEPVRAGPERILFQGWAVDDVGLRKVWAACRQQNGGLKELGVAVRGGERPDVSKLFPASSDRFNSAWALAIDPADLCAGSTATVEFMAQDVEGLQTLIGTRTVIRR